jgi:hypothetical protein
LRASQLQKLAQLLAQMFPFLVVGVLSRQTQDGAQVGAGVVLVRLLLSVRKVYARQVSQQQGDENVHVRPDHQQRVHGA